MIHRQDLQSEKPQTWECLVVGESVTGRGPPFQMVPGSEWWSVESMCRSAELLQSVLLSRLVKMALWVIELAN